MGDFDGHPFRGNQYAGGSPAQRAALDSARRELAGYTSAKSKLLATRGQVFLPTSDGPSVPEGAQRQCYANAEKAARGNPALTYVEGVAIANTGYRGALELTPHAWVVDEKGRVGDPTPTNYKIVGYIGVKIPTSELPRDLKRGETVLSLKVAQTDYTKNPAREAG